MSLSAFDDATMGLSAGDAGDTAQTIETETAQFPDDDNGRFVGASLALALLRAIPEAAYVMEQDGRVTYINGVGLRHLGGRHQTHRLYGSYLWDLWPDAPGKDLRRAIAEAGEGEAVALAAVTCPRSDATPVQCGVSISPVEDSNGRVTKILVLAREVVA